MHIRESFDGDGVQILVLDLGLPRPAGICYGTGSPGPEFYLLYTLFALGVSLAWGQYAPEIEKPVAEVLWVDGQVQVRGPQALAPLSVGDSLFSDRVVHVHEGASLVLLKGMDQVLVVDGKADLPMHELLASGSLNRTSTRSLVVPSVFASSAVRDPWRLTRGDSRAPSGKRALWITSPAQTIVAEVQPKVSWAAGGPVSLEVAIRRHDGRFETVESWRGIVGSHHRIARALPRGAYVRLRAKSTAGQEDQTYIYVLTEAEHRHHETARARLHAFLSKAGLSRPVMQGLRARWLENAGLYGEAEEVWSSLAKAHPRIRSYGARRDRLRGRSIRVPAVAASLRAVERWARDALIGMFALL